MASTNWDTGRKRCMPPTWDPPKLLLVIVGGLDVVVGTSSVVGHILGVLLLLDSIIWLRNQRKMEKGLRGSKATVSTHPKYSQARIYTTYAWVSV